MENKFSNLSSRIVVALVAIPVILAAAYYGGIAFMLFVLCVGMISLYEFLQLAKSKGAHPQIGTAMIGLVCLHLSFFHEKLSLSLLPFFIDTGGIALLGKLQLLLTVLFILIAIVLIVELFRNAGSIFTNVGATIFGIVYLGIFLGSFTGIRELFGLEFPLGLAMQHLPQASTLSNEAVRVSTYQWGGLTIIAILVSIWMCDTAAYFGGLTMGRHKLFPRVSPKKSWEGAVWGFAGSVITMIVFQRYFLPYLQIHQAVVIGMIIGIFGQIGDLIESLLKRDAGVKDSSALIPGHGGVFDRFDSLIFVSPLLYLYIDFVVLS